MFVRFQAEEFGKERMNNEKQIVGWREWVELADFENCPIKAKLDIGARTSALHTSFIERYEEHGIAMVRFGVKPYRKDESIEIVCTAPVVDERIVINSGGVQENRLVITTMVKLEENSWPIELTLTNRKKMKFRMLLGRTALAGRYIVDPSLSYTMGRRKLKKCKRT